MPFIISLQGQAGKIHRDEIHGDYSWAVLVNNQFVEEVETIDSQEISGVICGFPSTSRVVRLSSAVVCVGWVAGLQFKAWKPSWAAVELLIETLQGLSVTHLAVPL